MPDIDPKAVLLGLGFGLAASTVFFSGLAWGLRRALRARHPAPLLVLSFLLRASVLLGLACWLAQATDPLSALPAYALAFFGVRALALRKARRGDRGSLIRPEGD